MIHLIPVVLIIAKTIAVYVLKYAKKAYKKYCAKKEEEKRKLPPKPLTITIPQKNLHAKKFRDSLSPTVLFRYNKTRLKEPQTEPLLKMKPTKCHMKLR